MAKKKAFARYANNKIVPGSLILSDKAPKVGVWKEVVADLCCNGGGCVGLYAIALYLQPGSPNSDARAYYTNRDLQNISGQCADSSLAIGAKLYLDSQGTTPVVDGIYRAVDENAILNQIGYIVENGIVIDITCPA